MSNKPKPPATVVEFQPAGKGPKKGAKCPICAKPAVAEFRPFCSKRCADLDFGKWLDEGYRIPTTDGPDLEDSFDEED